MKRPTGSGATILTMVLTNEALARCKRPNFVTDDDQSRMRGCRFARPVLLRLFADSARDGFHRYHPYCEAGVGWVPAEVRTGPRRDAVLFSVGANAAHGLRRINEDNRRAVETLLADAEWATWSDSAIAKACAVNHKTVAAHRTAILGNSQDTPSTRTVTRNGTTYEQNTANIGKAKLEAEEPPATEIEAALGRGGAPKVSDVVAEPVPRPSPPASWPRCVRKMRSCAPSCTISRQASPKPWPTTT